MRAKSGLKVIPATLPEGPSRLKWFLIEGFM